MQSNQAIRLIGEQMEQSNCFGCSPRNAAGLSLSMYKISDGLTTTFTLPTRYESYPGIIHGGIVSTVLDEVMGNVIAVHDERLCFTTTLRVKFLEPLHPDVPYRCVARLVHRPGSDRELYKVTGEIHPADRDEALAMASASYRWITDDQVDMEMAIVPGEIEKYGSYIKESR
ncbi:MAG: PaaI family thioesterase [Proteobacteria bacterium]|nr:PaaI family thioesterase [Pseudomonadota bacterium]